jgi:hypothetical protein
VVSWQRIYNSLIVTSNYTRSLIFRMEFRSCRYSAATNSEESTQLSSSAPKLMSRETYIPKLDSSLHAALCCRILLYNDFCTDNAENTASIVKRACLLIRCQETDVLLLAIASAESLPNSTNTFDFGAWRLCQKWS